MNRSTPQQRDAQAKAYVARVKLAQEWAETMRVLATEVAAIDDDAHRSLVACIPSIAAEREAGDRARAVHQRELASSMRVVRANPQRLLERASDSNEAALADLGRAERALDDVSDEADEILAKIAASAPKTANAHNRPSAAARASSSTRQTRSSSAARPSAGTKANDGAAPASAEGPKPFEADVAALDAFLSAHGGPSLEWPDRAHAAFQRVVAALRPDDLHKPGTPGSSAMLQPATDAHAARAAAASVLDAFNDDAIAAAVTPKLAGQALCTGAAPEHRDVAEHLKLYREYLALVERRRVAVVAWKDARRVEALHADRVAELQRQRREDAAATAAARREQQRLARHHETAEQVRKWREDRAARAEAAAVEEAERRRQAEHAAVLRQRMHGAALGAKVAAHRDALQRQREVQLLGRAAAHHEAVAATNATLKNRRDQDAAIVAKRREAIEARKARSRPASAEPALRPRSSSASNAHHRDPSRLCAPTASSAARSSSTDARVQMTRGPQYLTPRHNHNIRTPAQWCGFQHMR